MATVMRTRCCISVLVVVALFLGVVLGAAAQERVVLRVYSGDYTPRERTSVDRWDPPSYFWTIQEEYQALHPHVELEFLPEVTPQDRFETWITTQYRSGTAPDVGSQLFSEVNRHYQKDWYVNLQPYLEQPNPYVEGNERWEDIFQPSVIATGTAPDGNIYVLPSAFNGTAIYYNRDIFANVGVDVPQTWQEFMEIQAKIQAAGYIPFAYHMAGDKYVSNWSLRVIQDMILDSKLGEIKGTGETIPRTMIEGEGISQKELVAAIRNGTYSALDPQWQEQLRLLKEWSQYWSPGYLGMVGDDVYRLFVTGRAAMMWESAARLKPLTVDALRQFEFGTFDFPTITEESSPYATGVPAAAVGGMTGPGAWTIAYDSQHREQAIDFLMFITSPQHFVPLANDLGTTVPGLRGVRDEIDATLLGFLAATEDGVFRIESFFRGLTRKYADQFYRVLQQYVAGRASLEDAASQMQQFMDEAAAELIEEHGWDDLL